MTIIYQIALLDTDISPCSFKAAGQSAGLPQWNRHRWLRAWRYIKMQQYVRYGDTMLLDWLFISDKLKWQFLGYFMAFLWCKLNLNRLFVA